MDGYGNVIALADDRIPGASMVEAVRARIRRGSPAVAGTVLMLLALAGAGLGFAGYRFPTPMQLSQSSRFMLSRVALAVALSGAAVMLAEVVVAAVTALRDHRDMPDRFRTQPWSPMLVGLTMLLFTVAKLSGPR